MSNQYKNDNNIEYSTTAKTTAKLNTRSAPPFQLMLDLWKLPKTNKKAAALLLSLFFLDLVIECKEIGLRALYCSPEAGKP